MKIEEFLRSMDVATAPSFEQYEQAAATLDRIVAAPVPPSRRKIARWVLIPVVVAALAAALIVLPWGIDGHRAYATWTPVPVPLTAAEIDLVGAACNNELRHYQRVDLNKARLALAERRGEYVAMLYRVENPETSASCLTRNLPGTDDVDDVNTGVAGSDGPAAAAPAGTFTQGALTDSGEVSMVDGAVGSDVVALTVHAGEFTTQATVNNGRWVAWWPGPALVWISKTETRDLMTYDLTLRDGTVIKDAPPFRGR